MTASTETERAEFEAWCDSNEYDRVTRLDGSGYNNEKTKRAWQAARSAKVEQSASYAPVNVWQQAVDNALVGAHLGVAGEVTAKEASKMLNDLICWNIEVATDPLTNGGKLLVSADATVNEWFTVEAAPVQLPVPAAWMLGCQTMGGDVGWKLSWSKSGAGVCHRLNGEEFEQPLYTEQQVRELLATHGIEEPQ